MNGRRPGRPENRLGGCATGGPGADSEGEGQLGVGRGGNADGHPFGDNPLDLTCPIAPDLRHDPG